MCVITNTATRPFANISARPTNTTWTEAEYYIKKAKERSQELYVLIETIFKTNDTPELLYKRCDGLMSLQRKTDPALYNKACQLAVDNEYAHLSSLYAH